MQMSFACLLKPDTWSTGRGWESWMRSASEENPALIFPLSSVTLWDTVDKRELDLSWRCPSATSKRQLNQVAAREILAKLLQEMIFTLRMVKHWNKMHREDNSPSVAILKTSHIGALKTWSRWFCFEWRLDYRTSPFNLNNFIIWGFPREERNGLAVLFYLKQHIVIVIVIYTHTHTRKKGFIRGYESCFCETSWILWISVWNGNSEVCQHLDSKMKTIMYGLLCRPDFIHLEMNAMHSTVKR